MCRDWAAPTWVARALLEHAELIVERGTSDLLAQVGSGVSPEAVFAECLDLARTAGQTVILDRASRLRSSL